MLSAGLPECFSATTGSANEQGNECVQALEPLDTDSVGQLRYFHPLRLGETTRAAEVHVDTSNDTRDLPSWIVTDSLSSRHRENNSKVQRQRPYCIKTDEMMQPTVEALLGASTQGHSFSESVVWDKTDSALQGEYVTSFFCDNDQNVKTLQLGDSSQQYLVEAAEVRSLTAADPCQCRQHQKPQPQFSDHVQQYTTFYREPLHPTHLYRTGLNNDPSHRLASSYDATQAYVNAEQHRVDHRIIPLSKDCLSNEFSAPGHGGSQPQLFGCHHVVEAHPLHEQPFSSKHLHGLREFKDEHLLHRTFAPETPQLSSTCWPLGRQSLVSNFFHIDPRVYIDERFCSSDVEAAFQKKGGHLSSRDLHMNRLDCVEDCLAHPSQHTRIQDLQPLRLSGSSTAECFAADEGGSSLESASSCSMFSTSASSGREPYSPSSSPFFTFSASLQRTKSSSERKSCSENSRKRRPLLEGVADAFQEKLSSVVSPALHQQLTSDYNMAPTNPIAKKDTMGAEIASNVSTPIVKSNSTLDRGTEQDNVVIEHQPVINGSSCSEDAQLHAEASMSNEAPVTNASVPRYMKLASAGNLLATPRRNRRAKQQEANTHNIDIAHISNFKSKADVILYIEEKLESMTESFTFKSTTYQTYLKHFLPRPDEKQRRYIEHIEVFPRIPTSVAEQRQLIYLRRICLGATPDMEMEDLDGLTIKERLDEMLTSLVNKIMFLLVVKCDTWYIHAPAREQIRERLLEFIWPDLPNLHSFFREHFSMFIDMRIRHFRDSVARYFRDRPRLDPLKLRCPGIAADENMAMDHSGVTAVMSVSVPSETPSKYGTNKSPPSERMCAEAYPPLSDCGKHFVAAPSSSASWEAPEDVESNTFQSETLYFEETLDKGLSSPRHSTPLSSDAMCCLPDQDVCTEGDLGKSRCLVGESLLRYSDTMPTRVELAP